MVEEEGTDEFAHQNNAKMTIKSGQELDKSVQVAKDFAKKNPDTLVLVLADHETGGFSIEAVDADDESGDGISKEDGPFAIANSKHNFVVDWTTSGHTAVDIPITAMGKMHNYLLESTKTPKYSPSLCKHQVLKPKIKANNKRLARFFSG